MQITFRMDDITPTMDWSKFNLILTVFNKYHLRPLLGIVPDNQDPVLVKEPARADFWDKMRELKEVGWSIAQHGYQHLDLTHEGGILGLNKKSEFAGLSFALQYERILAGQKILQREALDTNIWMAPFHSYDEVTLEALRKAGFGVVTDGYSLRPYLKLGLKFIPCQMAKPRKIPGGVITVCIHANSASDYFIKYLDNFMGQYSAYCVNFNELLSVDVDNGFINHFVEKMLLWIKR